MVGNGADGLREKDEAIWSAEQDVNGMHGSFALSKDGTLVASFPRVNFSAKVTSVQEASEFWLTVLGYPTPPAESKPKAPADDKRK